MTTQRILEEIDEVLARCGASKDRPFPTTRATSTSISETVVGNSAQMTASCLAAIERYAPTSAQRELARNFTSRGGGTSATVKHLVGILVSVRQDIEAGYLTSIRARARGEVLDDLLQIAEEIDADMHPAPAVVLAVSALEEHVRKLAEARDIPVTKPNGRARSFEDLVNDLATAEVLTLPEKRMMGGWYATRTAAAHGRFDEVVPEDVPRIIASVRDFLVRHPD